MALIRSADGRDGDARPVLLVLRALGLGDILTAVPALRALRRAFPDHRMVLAGNPSHSSLVAPTGVDEIVDTTPLGSIRVADPIDLAVNLHGSGPQSTRTLLDLQPARLWSHAHPELPATAGGPVWPSAAHETVRWCRLLAHHGVAADPSDVALPRPPAVDDLAGVAVVHPGAASGGRRWPAERFRAVVGHLAARGCRVVVTGGPGEEELCAAVGSGVVAEVVAGWTDLDALAGIVAHARIVVAGDTGVAHLATAFGTPSVVIFGPTPPAEWGPPTDGPHTPLWAGERGDPHAERPSPGLLAISVDDVCDAVDRRLAPTQSSMGEGSSSAGVSGTSGSPTPCTNSRTASIAE